MPTSSSNMYNAADDNTDWRGQEIKDPNKSETKPEVEDEKREPKPPTNSSSGMGLTDVD